MKTLDVVIFIILFAAVGNALAKWMPLSGIPFVRADKRQRKVIEVD
jgi:hypothetical protein